MRDSAKSPLNSLSNRRTTSLQFSSLRPPRDCALLAELELDVGDTVAGGPNEFVTLMPSRLSNRLLPPLSAKAKVSHICKIFSGQYTTQAFA